MQRNHASYNLGQSNGNLRLGRIRMVDLAANIVRTNLGVKGRLHLCGSSAEDNRSTSGGDFFHFEAVAFEPSCNVSGVGFGYPEAVSKLRRREPLMIVGGLGIVLRVNELIQGSFLRGVWQQR